jgi:hypothetical protein
VSDEAAKRIINNRIMFFIGYEFGVNVGKMKLMNGDGLF